VAEALAELVDNAIDARPIGGPVRVQIAFDTHEGWIRVTDDGHGMSRASLASALVLAQSEKSAEKIGKFGLGLKTACTSLGERFTIWTAQKEATYAHIAHYDAGQFIDAGEWKLPITRRRKNRPHGTVVTIDSARVYPALQQRLPRSLGWVFRHFLVDGMLELEINGVRVAPADYDVDPESVMPFEGIVGGKSVRGWVGLLRRSSQRGSYGFALVRHRRIIRRHEKLGFQPHPSTARVVGEIHLDDFDTNNLKTDFIRETTDWRELEDWVSSTIEPVLAQSRALAHAGMLDLKIKTQIAEERARLLQELNGEELNLPHALTPSAALFEGEGVPIAIGTLQLQHVFVDVGPDSPYLSSVRETRSGEADVVVVQTNLGHPAARVADLASWACHNVAEVAAHELGSNEEFTALKSIVLVKLLAERDLRRALDQSSRLREQPHEQPQLLDDGEGDILSLTVA